MSAWWEKAAVRHAERQLPGAWTCRCWQCKAARACRWTPPSADPLGQLAWLVRIEAELFAPSLRVASRTLARMCGIVSMALVSLARRKHLRVELASGQFADVQERHFWVLVDPPLRRRRGWETKVPLIDLTATQFDTFCPGVPRYLRLAPDDEVYPLYAVEATGARAIALMTEGDKDMAARLRERAIAALEIK